MINFNERKDAKTTVKVNDHTQPYVAIDPNALNKMAAYVNGCTDEIGWLGTVEKVEGNLYHIQDVFLFKQDVHATTTEITPEGLSEFASELLQQEDGMEIWNNMKLWGHSHVNMGVTPSGQDHSQMNAFSEGGHDWFMRLIANKKGELKIDIYDYALGLEYHDVKWERIPFEEEKSILEQLEKLQEQFSKIGGDNQAIHQENINAEIKQKVKKIKTVYTKGTVTQAWKGSNYNAPQQLSLKPDAAEDYFVNDFEVEREFGQIELLELAGQSTREVYDYLQEIGYATLVTMADASRVLRIANKAEREEAKGNMDHWYGHGYNY